MNGIKGYISIREVSYRWGVSERQVNQYCAEGRIPGASRFGAHGRSQKTRKSRPILVKAEMLCCISNSHCAKCW